MEKKKSRTFHASNSIVWACVRAVCMAALFTVLSVITIHTVAAAAPTVREKASTATAATDASAGTGQMTGPETGYAVKKPVLGGACKSCPWGAMGDIVKQAVAPYGWDVQVCYNCAGGAKEDRLVYEKGWPPPPKTLAEATVVGHLSTKLEPPAPKGPVDFGITQNMWLNWAYNGTMGPDAEAARLITARALGPSALAGEPPHRTLRLIANIMTPLYLVVAVKSDLGVNDLSELKQKHWPINIIWNDDMWPHIASDIMGYYGITKEQIEAAGGHVMNGTNPANRDNFDVAIFVADLSGTPEQQVGYAVTAKYKLTYLPLPDELLTKLAKKYDMVKHTMPVGYFLGLDHAIPTIGWDGNAIYGRDDMPDDFAYTLTKALYENQELFDTGLQHYGYHPKTVWKSGNVPLHPGAERFYREIGFIK